MDNLLVELFKKNAPVFRTPETLERAHELAAQRAPAPSYPLRMVKCGGCGIGHVIKSVGADMIWRCKQCGVRNVAEHRE